MLLTEYPLWLSIICLVIAGAGAWLLYRNNPTGIEGRWARLVLWILNGFRFFSIFIIAFLLLGPLLKIVSSKEQKPVIVFAVDNSQSILIAHDSNALKKELQQELLQLEKELGEEYTIVPFTVGKQSTQGTSYTFTDRESNLHRLFQTLKNTYDGSNLGAVVLASDGIYNNSENPLHAAHELNVPVFTIALGDSVQRKDVLIKNVRHNQLVYKGNSFPLLVDVAAYASAGQSSSLRITQNGKQVFLQPLSLSNNYFNTITTSLQASSGGTQHIVVEVTGVNGEISTANNRHDLFINVIDGKQKIALLAYTPHPDLSAYHKTLEANDNYTVEQFIISQQQFPANLNDYNLVILHQIPGPNGEGMNIIRQLKAQKTPVLYVLGSQTNTAYLNQAEPVIQINGARGNTNEVLPVYQNNFNLFSLTEDEQEHLKKFPPLIAPFGNYKIGGEAEVLFKQQIGYIKTEYPLIFFPRNGDNKSGFICGEGFWKWRIYDMGLSGQKTSATILGNTVQFLTSKKDQSRFRITGKKQFDENEPVTFDAELYNEVYQPVNTPEVSIVITNVSGKRFNYTFNKSSTGYHLDAGVLPPGTYFYEASAAPENYPQKPKGEFIIKPMQLEFAQTTANHQLLNELASQGKGSMFYPGNSEKLIGALKSNQDIKTVIYRNEEIKSWIELRVIFFILLFLLGTEWFIRKWHGSI